ncbi:MAG: phosphohydrolase [Bacteroidota bacterium]
MSIDTIEGGKIKWCIEQHVKTNHYYDTYLPYEFHLRMVAQVCKQFIAVPERQWSELEVACWGHDLIEDTRVSYNDCKEVLGEYVADIIYAVSNEKGKNRKERANEKYYFGILATEGALFVKLCDRISNVQYSKMTKSKMFEMYKKENPEFLFRLSPMPSNYEVMGKYLSNLFND